MTHIKYFTTIVFVFISLTCSLGQNVTLNTQTSVDAFNPNTTSISGNLTIKELDFTSDPIVDLSNLSNLISIGGGLFIYSNDSLQNIDGLSNLNSIGGFVNINTNLSLQNLDGLSSINSISNYLYINNNNSLQHINGLSNLTSISNYLEINNNNSLQHINGLSNLTFIGEHLRISSNNALQNIDGLSNITSIPEELSIYQNDVLQHIDGLASLISIGENLSISNTILQNIDGLSNLTSIGGNLEIINNPSLQDIDALINITSISGNTYISDNTALQHISGLSNITSIGGYLKIENNDLIPNINGLSNLITIGDYLLINNNTSLQHIDGLSNLISVANILRIGNNPALQHIDGLFNLTTIGDGFVIENNASLQHIDHLSNLISINGHLYIDNNISLQYIDDFASLDSISNYIHIKDNPSLLHIDGFSNLNSIDNYLFINSNASLEDINGFSNLDSIGGYLSIGYNESLVHINNFSNLISISEYLFIYNNTSLESIDGFSNLNSINGTLRIRSNEFLKDIDGFPNLNTIDGNLTIDFNNILVHVNGFSNLSSIDGYLDISQNDSLSHINGFSNLNTINGYLEISHNDSLQHVDGLSSLNTISGDLTIFGHSSLLHLDGLSNLTSVGENITISRNTALLHLNGLLNLTSVDGNFILERNNLSQSIDGLSNLTSINGDFTITGYGNLQHIDGLSNLTSIGGDFTISGWNPLQNLDGLSNLTSVGGDLIIVGFSAFQHFNGLSNLTSIGGDLIITNHGNLTECCGLQFLLGNPNAVAGTIQISNLGSLCETENEFLNAACGLSIKIFNDISQDCIDDNNEIGITNRQLIIQPGDIIGETNASGYWSIDSLPLGDYTITIDTSGSWSPTCPITQSFTVIDPIEETIIPSFGLISTEPCTAPDISIHMPFMRPCFENQKIYIQACNTHDATGILENAFVVVELDSLLIPTSSSIPYIELSDHMYQFDIGTLNPGICTDFWIGTTLSCDAVLGQGLCMEANLFPAEDCVFDDTPNPIPNCNTVWDMSSLSVDGHCENGIIVFEITNSGSGDMTCFSPIRIYINGNLIILDSIQLTSGETATFSFSGDGQSWRLEVDQHPLHPGNSQPNALVENCGGTVQSLLSFVNAMSLDDADPIVDIYCGIVTGSYDPNDKTGFPLGVNEGNDILPNQKIEYLIRFQNTGTDTAFTVVIRDTLSTDFDIFSVQSGVASHAYDFTINDSRAMEWTFNNILLPDSTTNEAGSHGFIKFTVNQIPDLAEGAILENTAAIYFDFNDPIITNTSLHTINYFTPNIIATTNISEEGCDDYLSPSGNYTWTNSGTYYDLIETENGDSIIIVDLAITSSGIINPTIAYIGDNTITANIPNAEYQWLDCNNNLNPIEGATEQNFTTTETIGNYAIQITLDGCTVISDCFSLNTTGIIDHEFAQTVSIQPNPTNNHVFVDLGKDYQTSNFTLRNILGQTILKQTINIANEFHFEIEGATGLYLLEIETDSGQNATFKILKH